jgi:peptide/nickel transport system substrate-binding protein
MQVLSDRSLGYRLWPLLLLIAGVPILLTGWVATSRSSSGVLPSAGGRLVEGVVGPAPAQINPLFAATSGPERDLVSLIFSGLTRPGPSGEPQPDLAESWVPSADGTTFTFNLRRNVTWHDGAPFTADDVVFTAKAFSAPGVKGDPSTAEVWRRASVQKLGLYTVLVRFDSPFAPFLGYSSAGILPSHLLAHDTPEQLVSDAFNQHPVGTGPFRLVRLGRNDALLRSYGGYHLGAPYVRDLSVRFIPDADALLKALNAGDLDRLRASGHALIGGLRPVYSLVYLNLNLAQFQDPVVRRALSLATDRGRIVQQVVTGQASPADTPLPPGTWSGVDQGVRSNPDAARALLQQAGWTAGADGILERRGIQLSFALQTTPDVERKGLAEELAREWRAVGINAVVETMDENALLSDVLLPHKYEAVLYGWDPGPDPDPFPAWHSSQAGEQGRNLSNYASTRADQLLEAARQTADITDRARIYGAFIDVFRSDVPAIVLYFPRYLYVVPQRLSGVQLGLLASTADRFAAVEGWSLATRRN